MTTSVKVCTLGRYDGPGTRAKILRVVWTAWDYCEGLSVRDVQGYIGSKSSSNTFRHLKLLRKSGMVQWGPGRTITRGPRFLGLDSDGTPLQGASYE